MKYYPIRYIILALVLISCHQKKEAVKADVTTLNFQNKAHELVYQTVQKLGDFELLQSKKDVVYTYSYTTPDGKKDVSTEKYIFKGELSYGKYLQHDRSFPELDGTIEQGYDGTNYWLNHGGTYIQDEETLKKVAFKRHTNYYWFCMFQKLLDPGLIYEYIEQRKVEGITYDTVNVSFVSKDDKPTDIYQLFINKKTGLVDQFLFTVADFGVMDEPNLMKLEYETIDGILLPTRRRYKKSNWNAALSDAPWIEVNWDDIQFDNELTAADFKK